MRYSIGDDSVRGRRKNTMALAARLDMEIDAEMWERVQRFKAKRKRMIQERDEQERKERQAWLEEQKRKEEDDENKRKRMIEEQKMKNIDEMSDGKIKTAQPLVDLDWEVTPEQLEMVRKYRLKRKRLIQEREEQERLERHQNGNGVQEADQGLHEREEEDGLNIAERYRRKTKRMILESKLKAEEEDKKMEERSIKKEEQGAAGDGAATTEMKKKKRGSRKDSGMKRRRIGNGISNSKTKMGLKKGMQYHPLVLIRPYARKSPDNKFVPPKSPYGLIQESYYDNPWKVLVICCLLNVTTAAQVKPILDSLFQLIPDPETATKVEESRIQEKVRTLGLGITRPRMIQRLSKDYLRDDWVDVTQLHGVGKYAADAYALFCNGEGKYITPTDKELVKYWKYVYHRPPKSLYRRYCKQFL